MQHENPDDHGHTLAVAIGPPTVAHDERSRTQGIVALAMFTLWMVALSWLRAMSKHLSALILELRGRPKVQ